MLDAQMAAPNGLDAIPPPFQGIAGLAVFVGTILWMVKGYMGSKKDETAMPTDVRGPGTSALVIGGAFADRNAMFELTQAIDRGTASHDRLAASIDRMTAFNEETVERRNAREDALRDVRIEELARALDNAKREGK